VAPAKDNEFLYAKGGDGAAVGAPEEFCGEGKHILMAAGLGALPDQNTGNRAIALAEFQRRGYFLTHVLECPVEPKIGPGRAVEDMIAAQLPVALARIRRSLKPRRIVVVSRALQGSLEQIATSQSGAEVLGTGEKVFALDGEEGEAAAEAIRRVSQMLIAAGLER